MAATRARNHETVQHMLEQLQREHGITASEAYDALITARYDLGKAGRLCAYARASGMALSNYLAKFTPNPQEAR